MKYLNKSFLIVVLAGTVLFAGCKKDFLDINEDPNRVTESNITPELIFPQAAQAVAARQASGNWGFLNNWLGYWAPSGSFAIDQTETSYNVTFTFGEGIWQNHYNVLFDLYQTKLKAIEKGDSVLAGASMILAAKLWQELVDVYGDIPYSQAFQGGKLTQPAFDKATDVYQAINKSLDSAIGFMKLTAKSTFPTVTDLVKIGATTTSVTEKQARWIRFANSLKLRLLIRTSEKPIFTVATEIQKIKDNGGLLKTNENVMVNPGFSNATAKQSPFYANYGLTPAGAEANTSARANTYFVNILKATNDPRIDRFFKAPTAGGGVAGNVYGAGTGNPPGGSTSGMGPGIAGSATQDAWILPAFEVRFMEAEAVARGWLTGTAKTVYESAVTESFIFLGVPSASTAAATYLANNPIANWDTNAGATVASQVKFILYQKYISLAGIDPLEAWSDLRRINYFPNNGYLSVNPSRISNTLPVRLLYPQSEYTTNSTNVGAEGTINLFSSKLFWQP